MKQKDKTQTHSLSIADLEQQIHDAKKQLKTMQFEKYTKQQKNVRETRLLRSKVAILETIRSEKQYEASH